MTNLVFHFLVVFQYSRLKNSVAKPFRFHMYTSDSLELMFSALSQLIKHLSICLMTKRGPRPIVLCDPEVEAFLFNELISLSTKQKWTGAGRVYVQNHHRAQHKHPFLTPYVCVFGFGNFAKGPNDQVAPCWCLRTLR